MAGLSLLGRLRHKLDRMGLYSLVRPMSPADCRRELRTAKLSFGRLRDDVSGKSSRFALMVCGRVKHDPVGDNASPQMYFVDNINTFGWRRAGVNNHADAREDCGLAIGTR
jgi:hypothetical protein